MEQMELRTRASASATIEVERVARERAQAAHQFHQQSTVAGCVLCEDVAYEPGWYALLASFARSAQEPMITLPKAPLLQI